MVHKEAHLVAVAENQTINKCLFYVAQAEHVLMRGLLTESYFGCAGEVTVTVSTRSIYYAKLTKYSVYHRIYRNTSANRNSNTNPISNCT